MNEYLISVKFLKDTEIIVQPPAMPGISGIEWFSFPACLDKSTTCLMPGIHGINWLSVSFSEMAAPMAAP